MTGSFALQGSKGISTAARRRSRLEASACVDKIAGTLQPRPVINEKKLRPDK